MSWAHSRPRSWISHSNHFCPFNQFSVFIQWRRSSRSRIYQVSHQSFYYQALLFSLDLFFTEGSVSGWIWISASDSSSSRSWITIRFFWMAGSWRRVKFSFSVASFFELDFGAAVVSIKKGNADQNPIRNKGKKILSVTYAKAIKSATHHFHSFSLPILVLFFGFWLAIASTWKPPSTQRIED